MMAWDGRNYQIVFLSSFLLLGICTRDWTLQIYFIPIVIIACFVTQVFLSQLSEIVNTLGEDGFPLHKNYTRWSGFCQFLSTTSWKSSSITALGLCLLLRGNHYQTMALASVLAIASKFVFRYRGKHFFNPANFGIIVVLVVTGDAWVSPGQWGTDWLYLLLFFGMAGIVLQCVGRWETSGTFLLVYGGLEMLRDYRLGWTGDVLTHQLMNGSLLLFAFFMITDPRSIPNARFSRVIWAIGLALLTFFLQHTLYLSTAMFWSLFILSPVTVLLDTVWSAPRFSWSQTIVSNWKKVKLSVGNREQSDF